MEVHPLEKLINPKSVIVAGASNNVSKMGSIQALNLMNSGFEGKIVFYHPREKTILGKPAYSKPEDLPFVPDLAMLVTPTKVTPRVLDELGQAGVRRAVVVTAGFREVGEEGRVLEEELKAVADKHGIRFVGPNCIGIINTHKKLNLTVFPHRDNPGGLALVSQSGTYITQTLPYLRDRGIRLSKAVSVGNSSNVDLVDWIDYLEHDPDTKAIALYIEGLQRGKEFIASAKRVAAKKPIVALYIGGTELGARSGMSHTGSMGGPDVLYDGVFEQAGVIRASTIDELYGWGHALACMDIPKGRRMAILTHSGGPASSMADQCERTGLLLPELSAELQGKIKPYIEPTASSRNPVDLTFSISYESFSTHLPKILMESDEIDGLLIHGLMGTGFMHELYENQFKYKDRGEF